MKRYLFISFFMLSLCSGYAQFGKGTARAATLWGYHKVTKSENDTRVPKVGELNNSAKKALLKAAQKDVRFIDSMFTIAKTDTFGIYCRAKNREINPQGMLLGGMQVKQFEACIRFLIYNMAHNKEECYNRCLERGVPPQTVQSLYRRVTLDCVHTVNQKPPLCIIRKEQRIFFSPWVKYIRSK